MALSEKFHWVYVDRDVTPELPKRFNVSAYPSLLVLGPEGENVHRFQSFKQPPEFLAELRDGLERWRLFRADEPWDHPPARPAVLTDAAEIATLPAPGDGVPAGIVRLGDDLWVGQRGVLCAIDPNTGAPRRTIDVGRMFQDFTTDGQWLYIVTSGWSRGEPIRVVDPGSGEVERLIVTAANIGGKTSDARGICWRDGRLLVSSIYGRVHEVDPDSGKVAAVRESGLRWVFGLAFDGRHFVTGGRDALHLLDAETMQPAGSVPVHYPLRAVGFDVSTGQHLCMEQPVFGYGREHERITLFPRDPVVYRLQLQPTDRRK